MFRSKKGGFSEAMPLLVTAIILLVGFGFLGGKTNLQNQQIKHLADTANGDIAAGDLLISFVTEKVEYADAKDVADLLITSVVENDYGTFDQEAIIFFDKAYNIQGDFKRTWSITLTHDQEVLYRVDGAKYDQAGTKKRLSQVLVPKSDGPLTISLFIGEDLS